MSLTDVRPASSGPARATLWHPTGRTKIVATIGPATNSASAIRALREAGLGVARLNLSHGDLDWHADAIRLLREVVPDVPILLDIPGRKIRTIQLKHEPTFLKGDELILTTDTTHDGTRKVPVNYSHLHADLSVGNVILADDGTLRFTVLSIDGVDIRCRAETSGQLKSTKGINVPYVKLGTRLLTDRDRKIVAFACEQGADYIGISFVESAKHVEAIRGLIQGPAPRIVSKIENQGGLDNMHEVIAASDAIMIDRGDLSVETNLENLAVMQKQIIEAARANAKPVIVATEMLHTMIDNSFPTKAEVTDIANAVFDGCAATMLSGETAVGLNPNDAVEIMSRVIESAEKHEHRAESERSDDVSIPEVIAEAIATMCRQLPITKIVTVTLGGFSARMISARRPSQPILAVTNDASAARAFNLFQGTRGVVVDVPFSRESTDHIAQCLEELWHRGEIENEDMILVTSVGYPNSGNRMNMIETHEVSDLAKALAWRPRD
ncbi:MAG: pyruvate kinase [Gemmatimonadota bacterium]|nr:MAG: pyruvate kinase [Gemmatimonadota bacterium]